jgi:hypothetical protein
MRGENTTTKTTWRDVTGDDPVGALPTSKLVCYLSYVARVVDREKREIIPAKFRTGFRDELVFSAPEKEELVRVAWRWHPDVMTGTGRFQEDKNSEFCKTRPMAIMELTGEHTKWEPSEGVLQQSTATMTVLFFKAEWTRVHFHGPVEALGRELIAETVRGFAPFVIHNDDFLAQAVLGISTRPPPPALPAPAALAAPIVRPVSVLLRGRYRFM